VLGRRRRDPLAAVQPDALPQPWRSPVEAALASRRAYQDVVRLAAAGPVRDRLEALGERVDAGVRSSWDVAQRAVEMTAVLEGIDVADATADHKAAQRELRAASDAGDVPAGLAARAEALAARYASAHRLQNALEDAAEQLSVIEVRLEAVVARAAELSFQPDASADPLAAELDSVVAELGALRQALDGL
jgi:hypothetical protein